MLNRERLFARLGPTAHEALVQATRCCRDHGNAAVELEHFLWAILGRKENDVSFLLAHYQGDPGAAIATLEKRIAALPASRVPVSELASRLEHAVERGLVAGQMFHPASLVRTGHILAGVLHDPVLQSWLYRTCREFERIPVPRVFAELDQLLAGSGEDAGQAPAAAMTGSPPTGDPLLKWCTDMTADARDGRLDPVVGRERELAQVIDIISRRRQNNPFLVGEAGVGKTAVVEALAQRVVSGEVPPSLAGARIINLDLGRLQAGAGARGEFETRLKQLVDAVTSQKQPVVLFCDEAHTLIGAGGQAGTGDAVNLLKPMLARGELRMIAATTWSEYKQFIEPDAALTRRFQPVTVGEPDEETACDMLRSLAANFARHHGVIIRDSALEAAVKLSVRHLPARQLPDKAISLLDTSCARVAQSQHGRPLELQLRQSRLRAMERRMSALQAEPMDDAAVSIATRSRLEHDIVAEAASISALERRLQRERELVGELLRTRDDQDAMAAQQHLADELRQWQVDGPMVPACVDDQVIAGVLADWTGIPVNRMLADDIERVLGLEDALQACVHGQPHAMAQLARAVRIARSGLQGRHRPLSIFLLAGPSGTGKTQAAIALADAAVGGGHNLLTFNMSEFQESHTASTLKGAPPGYVGYGKGGKLTEAVRRKPHCVVLLDEFDKAHRDVHDLFHHVFDKGWMEDGEGRSISFRQAFIVMTTNVGAQAIVEAIQADPAIGEKALQRVARDALALAFPESLLARMHVVPFRPLSDDALGEIAVAKLAGLATQMSEEAGVELRLEGDVANWVAERASRLPHSGRAVNELLLDTVLPEVSQAWLEHRRHGKPLEAITLERDGDALSIAYS